MNINTMPEKVLLITPPYHCGVLESAGTWMPLGMVYVAGSLQNAGYDVRIYDAMSKFHTFNDIRKDIENYHPDVVGTAGYTSSLYDAIGVLRIAKETDHGIITFLGGIHSNFCWEEILQKEKNTVDYIIRGEGEITTTELLDHIFAGKSPDIPGIAYAREGKIIATGQRALISDLDALP